MLIQHILVLFTVTVKLTEAKKIKRRNKQENSVTEVTVHPSERYYHVPFGYISLDGFNPAGKGPIDLLNDDIRRLRQEMSTVAPQTVPFIPNDGKVNLKADQSKWKQIRRLGKSKRDKGSEPIKRDVNQSPILGPPKDDADLNEDDDVDMTEPKGFNNEAAKRSNNRAVYLDFAKNHVMSLKQQSRDGSSFQHGSPPEIEQRLAPPEPESYSDIKKIEQFYQGKEEAIYKQYPPEKVNEIRRWQAMRNFNWTTCDEFGRDAQFYPKDVINVEWIPFFVWSSMNQMMVAEVHRFQYPTVKVVQKYKKMIPVITRKLHWEAPKLLMKTLTMDMLLIAADRKGKFDGLRYIDLPEGIKDLKNMVPFHVESLRMKSVGSYLAIMSCDDEYATIMAPAGNEPKGFEAARNAAAFLKFNGAGYAVERDIQMEKDISMAKMLKAASNAEEERMKKLPIRQYQSNDFPFNRMPVFDTL